MFIATPQFFCDVSAMLTASHFFFPLMECNFLQDCY
ncbi:hypothetical protein [Enterococcus ratti]